ncbi:MAG TPA: hypothetical protein ENI34_00560 [candidate division WOR-3 bacterium]|uniref:Uncharacterized protein n=1 Tax=candidate division WOR-3 bacterium TaxID=2052148 RepID=A0A9C9EL76_UNCW3|nr:hypothetical protein [candidate division WOR-3 bacterium]
MTEKEGKPPKELIFQCKKDDTIWLYVYSGDRPMNRFKTICGADNAKPDGWDGWFGDLKLIDANGDGVQDLILTVNSSFDLHPRGLFVYDIKNSREIWHYWIGGSPRSLNIVDVDDDNDAEIIVTTTAVANGYAVNGFDDRDSYVFVFDKKGVLLWHRKIGSIFSDALCWVGDIDDDQEIEIVITECDGTADKET